MPHAGLGEPVAHLQGHSALLRVSHSLHRHGHGQLITASVGPADRQFMGWSALFVVGAKPFLTSYTLPKRDSSRMASRNDFLCNGLQVESCSKHSSGRLRKPHAGRTSAAPPHRSGLEPPSDPAWWRCGAWGCLPLAGSALWAQHGAAGRAVQVRPASKRGNLLGERIQDMGKASLTKGRLALLAAPLGTAIMALALSACGSPPLASTSLAANSSPLASVSTSVSSPAPASSVSPSRAPITWPPPPVAVKPAAPVDGKPVASWKVYWGQRAPKWPPVDLVIEIWYKNPGRASTFGGTFTTPILPGQSGSSGRIPLDRGGDVTFVPMINNADGNVIWAPDPVTINVPPVP